MLGITSKYKRTLAAIPGFNVGHTIGSVVLKAKRYVDEVLVIDDGSTDDTVKVAEYAGAKVLRHKKNMGYGAAIQSCFRYARENKFDVMVIIDGDAQHDADFIQAVIKPVIENGTDVSIGSRFVNGNGHDVPRYRRAGIGVLTKLTNVGSKEKHKVSDGQSGFRAYSRNAILHINPKDDDMGVSAEILMQGRTRNLAYEEIPISCRYDVDGSTKKPVGHGLGVIISILKYMEVRTWSYNFHLEIYGSATFFAFLWNSKCDFIYCRIHIWDKCLLFIQTIWISILWSCTYNSCFVDS